MISIITSLYRSDKYLDDFCKHLKIFSHELKARKTDFEVLIIANEPTAKEKQLEKEFVQENWFKFFSIDREPLYTTWNRGVKLAKGEIVGFWNVDDTRYPAAIVEAFDLFKQGVELVYFPFIIKRYLKIGAWYLPIPGQKMDKQVPEFNETTKQLFFSGMYCGPFFLFAKAFYQKVGPFDEQFNIAGDFDWCVRAAKMSLGLKKAKSFGGQFRVDGGGLSSGGKLRHKVENNLIYKRHHIQGKIINLPQNELEKEYRVDSILCKGEWQKYV